LFAPQRIRGVVREMRYTNWHLYLYLYLTASCITCWHIEVLWSKICSRLSSSMWICRRLQLVAKSPFVRLYRTKFVTDRSEWSSVFKRSFHPTEPTQSTQRSCMTKHTQQPCVFSRCVNCVCCVSSCTSGVVECVAMDGNPALNVRRVTLYALTRGARGILWQHRRYCSVANHKRQARHLLLVDLFAAQATTVLPYTMLPSGSRE